MVCGEQGNCQCKLTRVGEIKEASYRFSAPIKLIFQYYVCVLINSNELDTAYHVLRLHIAAVCTCPPGVSLAQQ